MTLTNGDIMRLSKGGVLSDFPAINDSITVAGFGTGRVAEIDLSSQTITVDFRLIPLGEVAPQYKGLKPPILSLAPGVGKKFHVSNFHHFVHDIGALLRDSDLFEHRNDVLGLRIVAPWPGLIRRLLWRIMGVHIYRERCCICNRFAKKITAKGHGLCDDHKWFTGAALPGRELKKYAEMHVLEGSRRRHELR